MGGGSKISRIGKIAAQIVRFIDAHGWVLQDVGSVGIGIWIVDEKAGLGKFARPKKHIVIPVDGAYHAVGFEGRHDVCSMQCGRIN